MSCPVRSCRAKFHPSKIGIAPSMITMWGVMAERFEPAHAVVGFRTSRDQIPAASCE